ncbi:hypothetical protein EJ02DRAFT_418850 [Clathrospora elynae]|uniref:Uncharacterized protein n=1 Tax=Clathrospora elynae TaxID=706981 RepID=A0A6A5T0K8_9PLEO|nr:hypothetical protein EJ02DRAFT_418850 [Clathrospora elynae]
MPLLSLSLSPTPAALHHRQPYDSWPLGRHRTSRGAGSVIISVPACACRHGRRVAPTTTTPHARPLWGPHAANAGLLLPWVNCRAGRNSTPHWSSPARCWWTKPRDSGLTGSHQIFALAQPAAPLAAPRCVVVHCTTLKWLAHRDSSERE